MAVRLHGIFGVAERKADRAATLAGLFAGAFEHGFGPIQALHLEAEFVEQMRDDARPAGKVQRGAPGARPEVA
ncbi:hypothetical protein D3C87_2016620 [compost metagenome]